MFRLQVGYIKQGYISHILSDRLGFDQLSYHDQQDRYYRQDWRQRQGLLKLAYDSSFDIAFCCWLQISTFSYCQDNAKKVEST